ncbi:hypothetical protein BTHERMOSOX_572 [Bathymodiolus thermophilus thioautotrophic gill symbiont]|uniref:Uncharacterized protein n=2 Tax=Bathymodiolus thermophilus thioautotrophic gill symbiont TaxID=2360 RepID=A0A1J5TWQ8_9GAMM|nr:hypothetical protein MS2017_1452 [Bathymodiolus thermophilus thioautotrophic gill symbiont]OIR24636.1 hypothetical protein BGC33_11190 [Bathymodiolus thermophilus thioautotrophic gill symbiont]CAB5498041.1 hypothetical protein THERMOS_773 [Bathymodiolus thermophilus thioautotrophic gill symbiont]CAB5500659.1 hypothetical protein THERMOT_1283 [Bathymodiolus thermophilus thioautotrophic gill symbiont]SGZ71845.1 hypothetical protein BTHERMOSOX_572 [Bathymodiolus thermophilus thioautotrophic gil
MPFPIENYIKKALHKYIFYFLNKNTPRLNRIGFFGVSMKVKNIFFGFLKALLLVVAFCSSLLYANEYMVFDLQNYQPAADSPSPYFFQRDPITGNLTKVTDLENSFQFKTYNLKLRADLEWYREEVEPTLSRWRVRISPSEYDSDSVSFLSSDLMNKVNDGSLEGSLPREVHVAIYKGRVEAASYVKNTEPEMPEIDILAANPEGMRVGQTMNVKGAGSALLDYELKTFKGRGAEKVRLFSTRDEYYLDRGWKSEPARWTDVFGDQGACGRD